MGKPVYCCRPSLSNPSVCIYENGIGLPKLNLTWRFWEMKINWGYFRWDEIARLEYNYTYPSSGPLANLWVCFRDNTHMTPEFCFTQETREERLECAKSLDQLLAKHCISLIIKDTSIRNAKTFADLVLYGPPDSD